MTTLSGCIKKAGKALNQGDADAIKALRDDLRTDGLDPQQAAIEAVVGHIQSLLAEHSELTTDARYLPALPVYEAHRAHVAATTEPEGAPEPARQPPTYGADNKLVTADRAEEIRKKLKAKLNGSQLNAGIDPEIMALGAELAAFHIEAGVRKFSDFAKAIADDLGVDVANIRQYLRSWYNGARDMMEDSDLDVAGMDSADQVRDALKAIPAKSAKLDAKEGDNAERKPVGEEPDSGDRQDAAPGAGVDLQNAGRGRGRQSADEAGQETGSDDGAIGSTLGLLGPANAGKRSDQPLYSEQSRLETRAARDTDDPGSRPDSTGGLWFERDTDTETDRLVEKTPAVIPAAKRSLEGHNPADIEQIKAQMPFLTMGQAEDVAFAENRFAKPNGFGVLFTNGTGTGKTFTGLGIVKRLKDRGKGRILIAVPKQPIVDAWLKAGKQFFGLDIHKLESTRDVGKGIVVTTFANLGENTALIHENWDAFVMDEAHYLSSNQAGADTKPLDMLNALGFKRNTAYMRVNTQFPEMAARRSELPKLIEDYSKSQAQQLRDQVPALEKERDKLDAQYSAELDKARAHMAAMQDADKPRAIFLSATPFAYEKNVQWANEWLFDWGTDQTGSGYNSGGNYERFMMTHFGYRMRYNKLTEPDSKVDRGLMQRTFNTWMKQEKVLSARALDSDFDYDRKFVMTESAIGRRVDEALEWLREKSGGENAIEGMKEVHEKIVKDKFDFHSRMYFLEGIKAKEAVDHIKAHLALGRKVMVVHDYKKGGAVNPFLLSPPPGPIQAAYDTFANEFSDLIQAFSVLPSPTEQMKRHFPDAMIYNGDVTPKNRIELQNQFNSDAPGSPRLLIAQSDAMREGVSVHDTSGKYPRVEVNLGMPVKPTAAIQLEGRIYRTGQASNAMFRYFTIGTTWERIAFASKIAGRASAAENLAMGEQARGLKESFINSYEEANTYEPGHEGEGTGGKEIDKVFAAALTRWDMAKSFYFGTKKQGSGRAARGREGYEYFATPEPVGLKMVELADIRGGEDVLEPSAGHGAIGRWFPENATNRAIEFSNELTSKLALHFNGKVETGDFMQHHIVNKYDAIVMNPPYGQGGADARDHVAKAMQHLRDGGRIVALIPTGPAADKKFEKLFESDEAKDIYLVAEIRLPHVTFERAGTSVATRIVVMEKQTNKELLGKIQQQNRDYTDSEDIAGLFERMENLEIRPRTKPVEETADELLESAKQLTSGRDGRLPNGPSPEKTGGMETWEANHSQTGDELFMAKANAKVSKDEYKAMAAVAKEHGGYWSRFGKAGFLFKTEEARKAFVDAMAGPNGVAFRTSKDYLPDHPVFSKSAILPSGATPKGMSVDEAEKRVDQFLETFRGANDGLQVRVHRTQQRGFGPDSIQRHGKIKAGYDPKSNTLHIVAAHIESPGDLVASLRHEIFVHKGLGFLTLEKRQELIDLILQEAPTSKFLSPLWDKVQKHYRKETPQRQAEELLAMIAEGKYNRLDRAWIKIVNWLRDALIKMRFVEPGLSRNDLMKIVYDMGEAFREGHQARLRDEKEFLQSAHHGTHKRGIEKFSTDYIGTGEGTQAYGWGIYFAQKTDVANYYRDLNQGGMELFYQGEPAKDAIENEWARSHLANMASEMQTQGTGFNDAKKLALSDIQSRREYAKKNHPEDVPDIDEAITIIEGMKEGDVSLHKKGALYTVDVPEDYELLDWDATIENQPPDVLEKLKPAVDLLRNANHNGVTYRQPIESGVLVGEGLYGGLSKELGSDKAASLYLKSLGIPGLRFFDHMSRHQPPPVPAFTAWAGYYKGADLDTISEGELADLRDEYNEFVNAEDTRTRNFVIFDEDRIEITDMLFRVEEDAKSIMDDWRNGLGHLLKSTRQDFTVTVKAPLILRDIGVLDEVSLTKQRLKSIRDKHKDIPLSTFINLPVLLADPSVIYVRKKGETNAVIEVRTEQGEPILVGMRDGSIRTITPKHNDAEKSGDDRLFEESAESKIIYARNEEALAQAKAFGFGRRRLQQLQGEPVARGPGRNERVVFRSDIVKAHGRENEDPTILFRTEDTEEAASQPTGKRSRRGNSGSGISYSYTMGGNQAPTGGQGNGGNGGFVASSNWVMPEDTKMSALLDKWIYHGQNKQVDLKRVQKAIKDAGNKILEDNDAYLKEELFHGRSASRVNKFLENELDPLVADMAARKVSQEELGKYLWARHAKEANAHIARINPELPEGGSGMTDAEADAYMASLSPAKRADFEALAASIDSMVKETRDGMVRDDLISEATRTTWENAYQYYVPLFREMDGGETDPISHGMGTGQGYSIKGAESKKRTGSTLPVADILGNIANARDRAIVRGEKARVGRALYALALTNPNPEFWRTAEKAPLIKAHDKDGMVIEIPDPMFKQRDNVVVVKVKTGKGDIVERSIVFNDRDQRAMRMAHAVKNLDGQQLGELLSATASITRYFAKINTQYNPIFGIINLIRDTQASWINLSSTPLKGRQLQVAANAASIMGGVLKRGGRGFDGAWLQVAEEFEAAGGKTGYRDMFSNARERTEDIEKALDPDWWTQRPWGKALTANGYLEGPAVLLMDKGMRPVFDWLSDYNDTLENATRLAVYKEARDMNLSQEAAASLAKNITTNFNRKGEMALQAGALYAFFNASVQGTTRVLETLSSPAGRRILAGGIMVGIMQGIMMALAGYDDDEPPQFVRERNLIFPIPGGGGEYVSLAMPLGFNVLPNVGRLMVETLRGGDPAEKISSMMGVVADTFNPLGGSAPLAQIMSPTLADPIIALYGNQDWTGKPIARKDFNSLDPSPGFTRSKDVASAPSKALAKLINSATGGSDYRPGIVSPTGDQIDYLVGQLTGGIGREAIKAATTVSAIVGSEELPAYKVPLLGRFYGETKGQASQANRFYSNIQTLNEHQNEVKGLRGDKRLDEATQYLADNPEARLYKMGSKAYRRVQELRKRRRELVGQGVSKDQLERIDQNITGIMTRLNDRVAELSDRREVVP